MAKSKYEYYVKPKLKSIEAWARNGLTDAEIARKLGIGKTTFYSYLNEHLELSEVLKRGKEVIDDEVEGALLKRAMGYSYTEITKEACGDGLEVVKEVIKEVAPDTTAQIFWLKNRRPDKWRDRQEIKHSGGIELDKTREREIEELFRSKNADTR